MISQLWLQKHNHQRKKICSLNFIKIKVFVFQRRLYKSGFSRETEPIGCVCVCVCVCVCEYIYMWASQVALVVKNSLDNAEDIRDDSLIRGLGRSQGNQIPWRRATHSSTLAWRIPWTEAPGVSKSQTWLKRLSTQACIHTHVFL